MIGNAYTLTAVKFQGKMRSGIGLPALSEWIESGKASRELKSVQRKAAIDTLKSGLAAAKIAQESQSQQKEGDDAEKIEKELGEKIAPVLVRLHFLNMLIDVTETVYVVVERVLYDTSVDPERRSERAKLIVKIGDVMRNTFPEKGKGKARDSQYANMLQEASLAAQLETIARRDQEEFDQTV